MKRNRETSSGDALPELHSIFRGEVASLQPYGIFVKMPGCDKHGLVHISQISNSRVERPEEVVDLKEKIYCKVISIEPDGQKVGLSMKVVNQTTGQDLDPNQIQTSRDEQHRKKDFKKEFPKIELGAVFDTVCKKCGGKGHLAQDCFHVPGGKSYELVEEVFEWPAKMQTDESSVPKKHKKTKKESKKHKKKNKKDKSSAKSESKRQKKKHRASHSEDDYGREKKRRKLSSSISEDESLSTGKSQLHTTVRSPQAKEEFPTNAKHSRQIPSPEQTGKRIPSREHSGSQRKH